MIDADYALFAAVVEAGSIAGGARSRGLSAPMASKRLQRLEARLGARLVQRTTRRLTLTAVGERLHGDLVTILAAATAAEARVTGQAGMVTGTLRIAAPTSFARLHLAPGLHDFAAAYPRVALDVRLSDGFTDLLAERIDVAIRIAADVPAGLERRRVSSSRRVLCAAPAYLADHGAPASLAELSRHRLLAADAQLPWRLVQDGRERRVDGTSAVRTNSSELVRELAVAGMGIALRSLWDVGALLADGRLIRVLPEWEGSRDVAIWTVWPRAPIVSPAVLAFADWVAATFAGADW